MSLSIQVVVTSDDDDDLLWSKSHRNVSETYCYIIFWDIDIVLWYCTAAFSLTCSKNKTYLFSVTLYILDALLNPSLIIHSRPSLRSGFWAAGVEWCPLRGALNLLPPTDLPMTPGSGVMARRGSTHSKVTITVDEYSSNPTQAFTHYNINQSRFQPPHVHMWVNVTSCRQLCASLIDLIDQCSRSRHLAALWDVQCSRWPGGVVLL